MRRVAKETTAMQKKINQTSVIEEEEFQLQHMTPSCPQKPIIPPCLLSWGNFTFPPESFSPLLYHIFEVKLGQKPRVK